MCDLSRDDKGHLTPTQEWNVIATDGQTVHLLLGGPSPGGPIRFAHKHLLDPSTKVDDQEKAKRRATKRLDPKYRVQKDKKYGHKPQGMTRQEKYGKANAVGANTTIFLRDLSLPLVLKAIADAILKHDFNTTNDVAVTFSKACVYNHNTQGQIGQATDKVTINVRVLGTSSYALVHIHT